MKTRMKTMSSLDEPVAVEPKADSINRIDIKEFREFGYLQEVNRRFFHPLGMALEVEVHDDGTETLGGIWDYRSDPEGMNYGEIDMDKAVRVYRAESERFEARRQGLGYWIQRT